ncbi:HEAT repeat domain-containing protein [Verrucomicrobiota bacterium]
MRKIGKGEGVRSQNEETGGDICLPGGCLITEIRKQKENMVQKKQLGRGLAVALFLVFLGLSSARAAHIGILSSTGGKQIGEVLTANGHTVELLKLVPVSDAILQYDCLIIPGKYGLGRMTSAYRLAVMEYVARGFGVLLTADACGFRTWNDDFRTPFPEVEIVIGKLATMTFVVKGDHPVTRGLPAHFQYGLMAWDAIVMEPGPKGRTILTNVDGRTIGVAGETGKGRVVALGPFMGLDIDTKAQGPLQQLLLNSVTWLTGVKNKDIAVPFAVRSQIKTYMQNEAKKLGQSLKLEDACCKQEIDGDFVLFDAQRIKDTRAREKTVAEVNAALKRLKKTETAVRKKIDRGITDDELTKAIASAETANREVLAPLRKRVMSLKRETFPKPMKKRTPPKLKDCLKALRNGDTEAQRQAALEIGRIGNRKAIIEMLGILKDADADEELRRNIIYAAGWNRIKEAVDVLMALAKDKNVFLRRRAVQALGQIGDERALAVVRAAKNDPDKDVKDNAQYAEKWLTEGFDYPMIERPADYNYEWHKDEFARVQQLQYTSAVRPWPYDRLIRYAAEVESTVIFPNVPDESLPLIGQYGMRGTFFRGGNDKDKILSTLLQVGKYPAATVIHYDEPGGKQVDSLRELAEFTHGLRKDLLYSTVLMKTFAHSPGKASFAKAAPSVDIVMVDPYDGGAMEEAFLCDLQRSCARGVNWVTLSGFVPDPGQSAQDIAISYAHTQGMWPFVWQYYFKQNVPVASVAMRKYWQKGGRWDALVANYRKMAKIEPFLAHTHSTAPVALIFSERTGDSDLYRDPPNIGRPGRYFQNQAGIYHALTQQHIQFDSLFAEHLDTARLKQYKVLVLSDGRDLAASEAQLISDWVRGGGTLLAGGTITERLSEILPVTVVGSAGGVKDEDLRLFVYREMKPKDGFVKATAKEESEFLDAGAHFEYENRLGYRRVTVKPGAKILATWEDGVPSVVEGTAGKGRVLYFGADYMGLTHTDVDFPIVNGRSWFPQWKVFYPGAREFLASLVRGGLKAAEGEEQITVTNCPAEVEVKMLARKNGFIIHLTNYSEKSPQVNGIVVTLKCDPDKILRVHSPEDDTEISFEKTEGGIKFTVPQFSLFHRAVVVEMKSQSKKQ